MVRKKNKDWKPFIIANPIYDTVFKRLMENQRIAKFFLSTILEQQVEDITVMPQEFTYKLDKTKISGKTVEVEEKEKEKGKGGHVEYFSIFRLDFMATVLDVEGVRHKILIELQKSWDTMDVIRFRQYLGEQYVRVDIIEGKETVLPITTIYILGSNLSEVECPCVKVGRTYTDMLNRKPINAKSRFIENLTHNSYVIQAGRITDVRYTTNLDKLLSIFEQRYFVQEGLRARKTMKEYPYQPDDEEMALITDTLYRMGADPAERKQIENEEEALRVYNLQYGTFMEKIEEKEKEIEEKEKAIEEKDKTIEEKDKTIEEKDKTIEEKDKSIEEKDKSIEEKDKSIEEKDKTIEEKEKTIEEKDKEIAELKRLLRDKQVE